VRIASSLQDGRSRVVADAPIDYLDDLLLADLAVRAGKVARHLGLPERSPRQGGNQAKQEHRQTPQCTHLLVPCSRDHGVSVKPRWTVRGIWEVSNVFMTFAWYGHLKYGHGWPLWKAILVSRAIALLKASPDAYQWFPRNAGSQ